MSRLREPSLVILLAACGWLPADKPPQAPAAGDPDVAAFAHAWRIERYALTKHPLIADADAALWEGHTLAVTATGYQTPWQGTCEEAGRQRHERALADVTASLEVPRASATDFGLADPLVEYRFTCTGTRTPAFTLYVSGARAMTCWSGVCYLLER